METRDEQIQGGSLGDVATQEGTGGTETAAKGKSSGQRRRRNGTNPGPAKAEEAGTGAATTEEEQTAESVGLPEIDSPIPLPHTAAVDVTTSTTPARKPRSSKDAKKKKAAAQKAKEQVEAAALQLAAQNLGMLIGAISGIAATRFGQHWALQPDEINAIAQPAARIMARHNLVEKANNYGDYVAIAIALGAAIVPRVMITQQMKKEEELRRATFHQQLPAAGTGGTPETRSDETHERVGANAERPDYVPSHGFDALPALGTI